MTENENNTTETLNVEKAALRLIARAEQCSGGLSRKLEKRGHDAASINKVISRLSEQNLIDDSRFARMWLESHLRLTRSPRRLLSSLCSRGIEYDDARAALKTVLNEETELVLLRKFTAKYPAEKHFLINEGFSPEIIRQFLDEQ